MYTISSGFQSDRIIFGHLEREDYAKLVFRQLRKQRWKMEDKAVGRNELLKRGGQAMGRGAQSAECSKDCSCCEDGNPTTCAEMAAELNAIIRGEIKIEDLHLQTYPEPWNREGADWENL
jgi:hypothetical protein